MKNEMEKSELNIEAKGETLESAPRWTPEQEDAITRRGENLLVAAAAGSGKTSVMVERIRRIVSLEDIPVDSLLVVTFTKAAAAEMKDRIRKSLSDALDAEDSASERSRILRQQIRNLPLAQISTFHAFCMSIIKRFFYLTDVDPGTRVGEETEVAILMENALDRLLEEEFERGDSDFIEFMDNYSNGKSDYLVRDIILEANRKISAMPHGMEWAYDRLYEMENIKERFHETEYWRILKTDIQEKLSKAISLTGEAAEILENLGIDEKATQLRCEEIARYEEALKIMSDDTKSPEEIMYDAGSILSVSPPKFNPPGGELREVFKEVSDVIKALRGEARDIIKKKLVDKYFVNDLYDMIRETELDAEPVRTLLRLLGRFGVLYKEEKQNEGIIDFADIEHYAFGILEKEEASDYYRQKFNYIFVDEYQDTNLMQDAIIEKIKRDDNLFMVGDIKQSIYKFRLAEPSIFQGKYDSYKSGGEKLSDVIDLNRNHRSKAPILEFINSIFRRLMTGYDKDAELYPGIKYDGELLREPEIHVLMPNQELIEEGSGDGDPIVWDKVYLEAKHVASIIKENLGKPIWDSKAKGENKERPLEKRDMVILMRSVTDYAGLYSQALQEEGIDAYLEGDDGYFDTLEISAFINLLEIIDSFNKDVPLLSVLHSGIFGFSASELAKIRVLCKKGSFAEAFLALCEGNITMDAKVESIVSVDEYEELKRKCSTVLARINYWHDLSLTMPLDRYIWRLMLESNCYVTMGALPRGASRQANLRALCDMAEKYTRDRQATLYGFINYVSSVKNGNVKIPEVSSVGEGDDVVRIMTIHKSKGLEFPMVVVSGLGNLKSYGDSGTFNIHKDIGLALTLKSGKNHWEKKTMIQSMIASKTRQEEIEEEIRVLYVGLTRARDILYLVGYEEKDVSRFADNGIMSNTQYMKMILPGQKYNTVYVGDALVNNANTTYHKKKTGKGTARKLDEITEENKKRILDRLNYEYPFEKGRQLKSKYSVTELNKMSDNSALEQTSEGLDERFGKPSGENRRKTKMDEAHTAISASDRGIIYHTILERIDFSKVEDLKVVDGFVAELVEKNIISSEVLSAINLQNIKAFFDSEIGRRAVLAAKKGLLEKERPFTLAMDMDGQEVLVQGIIDCYFRECTGDGTRTILLDYKSNRIYEDRPIEEEIERVVSHYRKQLEIYKKALVEAGMGPVDEVYLYLLDIGQAIAID